MTALGPLLRALTVATVAVASASPALAQTLGQGSPPEISWWRIAAALLLCILLAGGAALALHARMTGKLPNLKGVRLTLPSLGGAPIARLFSAGGERRLKSIETIRVSPFADVCLFTCDGKTYLVAATPQGVTVIERQEGPPSSEPEA